jgi:hypothetical protein
LDPGNAKAPHVWSLAGNMAAAALVELQPKQILCAKRDIKDNQKGYVDMFTCHVDS